MAAVDKFRSAFNGFNREDVVSYLDYVNNKNNQLVNRLNAEIESLRAQQENAVREDTQTDTAALTQERDELLAQVAQLQEEKEALSQRCNALEQELEQARSVPAAEPREAPVACTSSADELACYRRAERVERLAKERADVVFRQTNDMIEEVSLRVTRVSDQIFPISDEILSQLTRLQDTIQTAKQSLQEAAEVLTTLKSGAED